MSATVARAARPARVQPHPEAKVSGRNSRSSGKRQSATSAWARTQLATRRPSPLSPDALRPANLGRSTRGVQRRLFGVVAVQGLAVKHHLLDAGEVAHNIASALARRLVRVDAPHTSGPQGRGEALPLQAASLTRVSTEVRNMLPTSIRQLRVSRGQFRQLGPAGISLNLVRISTNIVPPPLLATTHTILPPPAGDPLSSCEARRFVQRRTRCGRRPGAAL